VSAAPGGYLSGEDLDDVLLRELRDELAGHGIVIDDPAEGDPVAFRDIPGAWCEIGLMKTGALVWTYLPEGRDLGPDQAARFTLALLGDPARPTPEGIAAADPGLRLNDAAGRVLAACGLAVHPAGIDYGDGEVHPGIFVTSPARQARGYLLFVGGCELRWECRFSRPGRTDPGLSPSGITQAIAAAVAGAAAEAR
jgi:hypothetical protein